MYDVRLFSSCAKPDFVYHEGTHYLYNKRRRDPAYWN
jgi:hypothetical protein